MASKPGGSTTRNRRVDRFFTDRFIRSPPVPSAETWRTPERMPSKRPRTGGLSRVGIRLSGERSGRPRREEPRGPQRAEPTSSFENAKKASLITPFRKIGDLIIRSANPGSPQSMRPPSTAIKCRRMLTPVRSRSWVARTGISATGWPPEGPTGTRRPTEPATATEPTTATQTAATEPTAATQTAADPTSSAADSATAAATDERQRNDGEVGDEVDADLGRLPGLRTIPR